MTPVPPRQSFLPGKTPRSILAHSISVLLVPLAISLGVAALTPHASAAVTDTKVGGTLTDLFGAANDTSTLSTTATSASDVQLSGTGFTTQIFTGVTQINVDFNAANQIVTFDSTNFTFPQPITILTSAGASNDEVVKNGANTITLAGLSTYSGGTTVNGGTLVFNTSNALGSGTITLADGTELRGTGTETLNNDITVGPAVSAVVSTTGTLTLNGKLTTDVGGGDGHLIFGSAGHAGTVILNPDNIETSTEETVDVAFGTVRNGGSAGILLGLITTNVHAGATFDVNDQSMYFGNLQGSGSVKLGSKASTSITLNAGAFAGIISGAGGVETSGSATITLTGANTYTGGTTIDSFSTLQIGSNGTTGSVVGNIANSGTLTFNRSNALTYAGVISGTGSIVQNGTGVLTLTGDNTFKGGASINAGVIVLGNSNALGTGNIALNPGGELRGTGTETLTNLLICAGTSDVSTTGTLTLNGGLSPQTNNDLVFGSASHAGTIIIGPSSVHTASGASIDIAFGTVRNGGGTNQLNSDDFPINVHAGATLSVNDLSMSILNLSGSGSITLGSKASTTLTLGTGTFGGIISGAGSVQTTATQLVTFTGANTYTGGTNIVANSTLDIGSNGGGPTGSVAGNITDNGGLVFNRTSALTYAGIISGAGVLTQDNSGVLTLNGNSSMFSGSTFINLGAIVLGNSQALGSSAITVNNGGELRGTGTETLNNTFSFTPNGGTAIVSTTGTLTLTGNLTTGGSSDIVFGSAGHAGTIIFNAAGTTLGTSSSVDVAFGTLRNGGTLNLLTSGTPINVHSGATLSLNDINTTVTSLNGAGSVTLGSKATTTLTLGAANFSGVISGAGSVATSASQTVTLTGANTYTGGTTIVSNSTLQIGNSGVTGSIVGNVADSGVLSFNRGTALTYAGIISGTGQLEKNGGGVLTLSGNSTFSGGTQLNSGVIDVSNNNALGTGQVTLATGTELRSAGTVNLANKVTVANGATATISATGTLNLNGAFVNNGALTFGSTGNAGTVVVGSGLVTGTGNSTVDVAFGTLRNGGNLSQLTSGTGATTVHAGATLSLNDQNLSIVNLQGAGSITLGTKASTTLTLFYGTFQGIISGAGAVEMSDGLTMTLTGANTYTGGTTIPTSTSMLQIGTGGTTGSIAGNVTDNGTLDFDRANALTYAGKISGTGSLTQSGAGVLTLSGSNSFTGGTTISAGVISINNANALGIGSITLDAGAELRSTGTVTLTNELDFASNATTTVSTSGTLTLSDVQLGGTSQTLKIGSSGNAGVVVFGPTIASTLSISTSSTIEVAFGTLRNGSILNTYTSVIAATDVDKGATLSVNDQSLTINNLNGAGAITLGTKAATTLSLNEGYFTGPISGAGQVIKTSNSPLFLSGASTYTGGTTLSGGQTSVYNSSGSATGSGPVSIGNGATLCGSGTVSGPMTLLSGGTIAPSEPLPANVGTKFHGSSLIWDAGGTLQLAIGTVADELLLTGALTRGTTGIYTIDIENAPVGGGIVPGNYTLITFSSSNFLATDFKLDLPLNYTGMLVKTNTSLILEDLVHSESPVGDHETASTVTETTHTMSAPTIQTDPSVNPMVQGVPEPGSTTLLLLGLGGFLARRRRNAL